tara:strand:- start:402 stop:809 length:408 start_codon:yes stop_codon:yes gene_type:complete
MIELSAGMWAKLFAVLMMIESGGEPDPASAVGDNGASVGALQIQMAVIEDVNRVYRTQYDSDDRKCIETSKEICRKYLTYWINRYHKNTGNEVILNDFALCWNGGCHWYKAKPNSSKYIALQKYNKKFVRFYGRL